MAKIRTCHSFRHNPPLDGEDELARGSLRASIKDNNTSTPSPAIFWAQTPAPALPPALAPSSIKELCQQLLKTYAAIVKLLK